MAQSIVLKRSALSGKVPDTGSLSLGEVAINTYDGRVFFKKSGSVQSVEQIITTNSITTGSITLTQTGSFGEIVVTQDGNFQRDIFVTRDIVANGDIDVLGSLTASLSNGYVWVGNSLNKTTLVPTSSFGGAISADVNLLISKTGSYATTGSNTFYGNQTIAGNVLPNTANTHSLGSLSNYWNEIYLHSTSSIKFIENGVVQSTISSTGDGGVQIGNVVITTSSIIFVDDNGNTTQTVAQSSSVGSFSNFATTGSNEFFGNQIITGSLIISGSNSITASRIGNPFGDIIISPKSGSINTGSIELHGGLKWKRTSNATPTEIGDLITFGGTMGLIEGGGLTTSSVGGLVAQAGEAVMYTMTTFPYGTHNLIKYDTLGTTDSSRQITLPQTSSVYVYYNNSGVLTYASTAPSSRSNVILGKVTTDSTKIIYIDASQINAHHYSNYIDRLFREALGPIFSSGGIVTQGTISGSLNVTAATYFFSQNRITTNAGTNVSMDTFYRSSTAGQYVRTTGVTTVSSSSYDSGSGVLVNIPSGKYAKHSLYILGDNSLQATATEAYMLVYGQSIYDTLGDAQAGSLPSPPSYFTDSISIIASIVVTPDSSSIQSIIDERPRLGFISPSKTGVLTAHADLSGLTSDDHPQYILVDGTRTLTGNLNLGNNDITNVDSITATTINGSINATNGVVSGSSQIISILNPLNSFSSSTDTKFTTLANVTSSLNTFTSSANSRLNNLESFTASLDVTYVNQTELSNATGSLINSIATKLDTSSFQTYTGSLDNKFTNLSNTTASLNASTASQQNSIDLLNAFSSSENTKNSTLATYTSSIDTKFTTLATYTSSVDTKFTTLQNVTSSILSFTSSANSRFSNLESFTASLDVTYVNQTELANATGSLINSIATKLNTSSFETYTGSIDNKFITLASVTSSLNASSASQQNSIDLIGQFTASEINKNTTLATYTGSIDNKFSTLSTYTASVDIKFTTLAGVTSSLNQFTSSANSRFSNIESFTASLDVTYVNQTELATATGSLINSIATKLNTSSFETYTGSIDNKFTTLSNVTSSLNASTASQQISIDALNVFSSSEINKNTTLATYTGSIDGKFTTLQNVTSSILSFTSSANSRFGNLESFTASIDNTYVNQTELANATGSLINSIATKLDTSSFQTYTGSIDNKFTTLASVTSSINTFTASTNSRLNNIESFTSSLDVTYVNQTELANATGSLINSIATKLNTSSFETYTGSIDSKFITIANVTSSLNASTASQQISIDALNVFSASEINKNTTLATYTSSIDAKFTSLATYTGSVNSRLINIESTTASLIIETTNLELFTSSQESKNSTLATYTASIDNKFTTLSNVTASLIARTGSYATTGSNSFLGNQTITGSLVVSGSANIAVSTATISSPFSTGNYPLSLFDGVYNFNFGFYASGVGSNRLSIYRNASHTYFDNSSGNFYFNSALIASSLSGIIYATNGVVSGSSQIVSILQPLNSYTSSIDTKFTTLENITSSLISKTGSYATTGSNLFYGNQTISGSIYLTGDFTVLGSSSIQNISSSTLNIGTNLITVAVNKPAVRFGGLSVIDSGSSNQSGSFLYDSVQDEFIFVHKGDGTNITSSHFLLGPETYNDLGNETYIPANRLLKSNGNEHISQSNIIDTGTKVIINSNTEITGSLFSKGSGSTLVSISGSLGELFKVIDTPTNILAEVVSGSYKALEIRRDLLYTSGAFQSDGVITGSYFVATNNGNGINFKVGDDVWIGDVNVANTMQITGQQAASSAHIKFGSGSSNPVLGANNSSTLELTGSLSISGSLTIQNRPAFSVYGSGTTNNLTTTQNTDGTLNSNNFAVDYQQGSSLNTTTGIFTAPTAGLYQVDLIGRNSGFASGISQLAVLKNNSVAGGNVLMIEWGPSSTMNHAGGSKIFKLSVGDTLRLKVLAGQINFDGNDNWSVAYIG